MQTYDIIIIGGGIVGRTAALALAQQTDLQIVLLDAKELSAVWQPEPHDYRVSAITLASKRIFQHLQVWPAMQAKRINPFKKMFVWDAETSGELQFDCESISASQLGFIIEDQVMGASLAEKFSTLPNLQIVAPIKLISLHDKITHQELITSEQTIQAKLVIAADGGNSWVRKQAQIETTSRAYEQQALVATVQTTLPHQATAWQCFLTSGPLAFLPLQDANTSSIVWSTTPDAAERLLTLDDAEFQQELTTAFAAKLGTVINVSPRYRFNLNKQHAKNYVKPRLALVGDAAHTIHPMVGQGVNLGLLDVACLVATMVEALAKKRDFASWTVLRRYERWRKGDNATMLAVVDGLKYLFTNTTWPVPGIRDLGLNSINKMSFIKNFLANYAAGNRSDMPPLASCQTAISMRE